MPSLADTATDVSQLSELDNPPPASGEQAADESECKGSISS